MTLQTIPLEWNEQYSMYHLNHFWYEKGWIENFTCIKPVRLITSVSAVGYDGYYDDVLPTDTGEYRQGLDQKTVRNILYLLIGVVVVVGLCVILLYYS